MRPFHRSVTAHATASTRSDTAGHGPTVAEKKAPIRRPSGLLGVDVGLHGVVRGVHLVFDLPAEDLEHRDAGQRDEYEDDDVLDRAHTGFFTRPTTKCLDHFFLRLRKR